MTLPLIEKGWYDMHKRTSRRTLPEELRRLAIVGLLGLLFIAALTTVLVAAQGRSVAEDPSPAGPGPDAMADSAGVVPPPTEGARVMATDRETTSDSRTLALLPSEGARVMAAPPAGTAILVSVNLSGTDAGNGGAFSYANSISANGRYVVFTSDSSDLAITDTNGTSDVFVRDLADGTTKLVSINLTATDSGNGSCTNPYISANGRYVAFQSDASDLVVTDTNGTSDVFVRDLVAGTTALVSESTAGTDSGNGYSGGRGISADGRYVTFHSDANDLVVTDTNGSSDVFVRDTVAGTTSLVSINSGEIDSGNGESYARAISDDGRYVAFDSLASDLVVTDTNGAEDVFVRDMVSSTARDCVKRCGD